MNNQYSAFCKCICDLEAKEFFDQNGKITTQGKDFIEMLETKPETVLSIIKKNRSEMVMSYTMRTGELLSIPNTDEFCLCILESLKERFLSKSFTQKE